jgi:hypothetical protein
MFNVQGMRIAMRNEAPTLYEQIVKSALNNVARPHGFQHHGFDIFCVGENAE